MERLVGANAAVEDALASLLVDSGWAAGWAAQRAAGARGGAPGGGGGGAAGSGGVTSGGGSSSMGPASHAGALRRRAALTYVKRLYSPYLLREPLVQQYGDGGLGSVHVPRQAAGRTNWDPRRLWVGYGK